MGILRKLQLGMLIFGISMGFIFPLYARFFVEFKTGMQLWFDIGCVLAGIMVGGFSYFLTKVILVKQLAKIASACRDISSGKTNTIVSLKSPDAIGDIADGFNIMVGTLQDLFNKLSGGIINMTGVTDAISSMSETLTKTIEQEAIDVSNVTAATHESAETVAHISNNLTRAGEFSRDINEQADQAGRMLSESMETMHQTNESINNAIKHMEELSDQSKDISEIISMIDDVAEQTNLLALNAAIEAARAGEHGRGFAVVADEVKKLAEKTSASTKKTGELINSLQNGVEKTIDTVKNHSGLVITLQDSIDQSSTAMSSIFENVEHISGIIDQISTSVSQQTEAYTNINATMEKINMSFDEIQISTKNVASEGDSINEFTHHMLSLLDKFENGSQQEAGFIES